MADPTICKENRALFEKFFAFEEYKLKRINGLPSLDEPCYKTLGDYCLRLRTANKWFRNKPWKDITEQDIKNVYDNLEDGKILNQRGQPFGDKASYYNKIFKSKPFALVGKDQMAREIINTFQSHKENEEVRFVEMEDFQKLIDVAIKPLHKFLLWLAWDIGENINSLLQLKKKDFYRQFNDDTKTIEYRVNLPFGILKRSRKPRSELTNYPETAKLAEMILEPLSDEDNIFPFQYAQAKKIFNRAVYITGIKCKPRNQKPTWKDLRSGMACYLLKSGWHTDEINARLGHQPSSNELNKYVNFLALDRHQPKKKLYNNNLAKVQKELEEEKDRGKLICLRVDNQKIEIDELKKELSQMIAREGIRQKVDPAMNKLLKNPQVRQLLFQLAKQIKQARQAE